MAVVGERADGHDYAGQAGRAGAVAVLGPPPTPLPAVVVKDVQAALQALAAHVVAQLRDALTVAGLTGSRGKTSTKDLLAAVLSTAAPTVAAIGSLNNELGVPLTMLRADAATRSLVLEMGARRIGDIARLTGLVAPDIAVVLNVGQAHLSHFGSRKAIAKAKGELVQGLTPGGTAVLNADDPRVVAMRALTDRPVLTFSRAEDADVRVLDLELDRLGRPSFTVRTVGASAPVALPLVSAHQALNASAAAAAGLLTKLSTVPTWRGIGDARIVGHVEVNKTRRIGPETMEPLLAWSLRMLEDIGPDIAAARREWQQVRKCTQPSQEGFTGLSQRQRLALLLTRTAQAGGTLPGKRNDAGHLVPDEHWLCRLLGAPPLVQQITSGLQRRMVAESGLPLAEGLSLGTPVTGMIDGRPWRDQPITARELPELTAAQAGTRAAARPVGADGPPNRLRTRPLGRGRIGGQDAPTEFLDDDASSSGYGASSTGSTSRSRGACAASTSARALPDGGYPTPGPARHQNMPSHTGNYRRGVRDVFSSSAHTPTWAARARIGWRFGHYPSYIRQLSQARKSQT